MPFAGLVVWLLAGVSGDVGHTLILYDGTEPSYSLHDRLVIVGSESAYVAGLPLDPSAYVVEHERGRVTFVRRLPDWTPVLFRYRCVRFTGLRAEYLEYKLTSSEHDGSEVVRPTTGSDTNSWAFGRGLDMSGSKSLEVAVGATAGVTIDQATRIGVSGDLEGVRVKAELSDQSSPIPPEGITRSIDELDRIVIDIESRGWQGRFGEVELTLPGGSFGGVARRATGARVGASFGQGGDQRSMAEGWAGYARPRGQHGRMATNGIDGVQGPYPLAADGRDIQVVPGTEEIYLDGAKLTRGWDADYTIDYSTGEFSFTSRHIVSRRSRIEAEFLFSSDSYERAISGGGLRVAPGILDISATVLSEGDNRERAISQDFTPEQRQYLAGLGADTGRAWLSGAQYVGAGNGDYVLESGHFRFAGRNLGDYVVRFTSVAESTGSYVYDALLLAYRYAGPGLGNYRDSVRAVLPQRQDLAQAVTELRYRSLSARLEGLFRRYSLNLLTPGGASMDAGAFSADAGWAESSWSVSVRHRSQGTGFALPGQAAERDFRHRWGGTTENLRRISDEAELRWHPGLYHDLVLEAGRLLTVSNASVSRLAGRTRLWWASLEASRAGDITRYAVRLAPTLGLLMPTAAWETELREDVRDRILRLGVSGSPGSVRLDFDGSRVDTDRGSSGSWRRAGTDLLVQGRGSWNGNDLVGAEATAGWQRLAEQTNRDRWFGTGRITLTPRPGISIQSDVSQAYRRTQIRDELFRYVGPGQGNYRLDTLSGRYIFDPAGDHERVVVSTGRFVAARDVTLNLRGDVTNLDPLSISATFNRVSSLGDSVPLSEATVYDLRSQVHQFEPLLTVVAGATGDASADRTLAVTGRHSERYAEYVELESERIPATALRVRGERVDVRRRLAPAVLDYVESGWRGQAWSTISPVLRLEVTLGLEAATIFEPLAYPELGSFRLTTCEAGLARTVALHEHTRLRASVSAAWRYASVTSIPFDVALTRPVGLLPEASAEVEHVLSSALTFSARYRFGDRPDRPAEHTVSATLNASF